MFERYRFNYSSVGLFENTDSILDTTEDDNTM